MKPETQQIGTFFQERSGLLQTVEIINPLYEHQWDDWITRHPNGWLCHLSDWKQVLENSFPHIKGYYFALRADTGMIQAGLPIYLVKSNFLGSRLVSIPFATISDPLIGTEQELRLLFDAVIGTFKNQAYSHVEIRAHRLANLSLNDQFCQLRFYKHHFLELASGPEQLIKSFDRSCVRQKIQKARCSDLRLIVAETEAQLRVFYQIYFKTRKRLSLPAQPYHFFKNLWEAFFKKDQLKVLLAEKNKKAIAGLLLFTFKDRVSTEFAASDTAFKEFCPNHFLFWEAIQLAYQRGFQIFDFGRTSPNSAGLMNFKKRWGTQVVDLPQLFYPGTLCDKINNYEKSISYQIIRAICNRVPDFVFKQISDFCYRHLG